MNKPYGTVEAEEGSEGSRSDGFVYTMTSLRPDDARLVSGTVPVSLSVRSIEGTTIFIRLCSLRRQWKAGSPESR
jgi:hypothetical protein